MVIAVDGGNPLRRISLKQVEQVRLPIGLVSDAHAFRRATNEKFMAKLRQVLQILHRLAHGLEPLKLERQPCGHLVCGGFVAVIFGGRQQHFRFEIGEPRGHDEIVCGEL